MKNSETRSDGPELLAEVGAVGIWCLATLQCLNLFAAIYDRVCECVRQCVFGCARECETACVCVCVYTRDWVCLQNRAQGCVKVCVDKAWEGLFSVLSGCVHAH